MSKPRAVLDANVLYGNFCRDLLLSLFAAGIYEAKWTEQITREWVGHLLENRPNVTEAKIGRTVALMNQIQPTALVERYEQFIGRIDIPDKDDRHVVAAAIACGAQKILTWNLGDFPNQILAAFGVVAESPDKFVSELIIDNPMAVVGVFKGVRERFKAPPMSVDYFFESLKKNHLDLTAKQLARYHDLM
ncbi:PIN domain-containing protein [Aquabacterium sp. A7-Y]|uniref:PIN domain-containing protein n=1 Tax=Aquabacterium sp. A7-Y TaxID=1349605 RepID=UPI00223DED21|nr:PIN domain-containing protein [Aquabacterium sp. A7-Y]MCW7540099.1 PIN domain-containing protein [Aquabacterium sp. A7-Y]